MGCRGEIVARLRWDMGLDMVREVGLGLGLLRKDLCLLREITAGLDLGWELAACRPRGHRSLSKKNAVRSRLMVGL